MQIVRTLFGSRTHNLIYENKKWKEVINEISDVPKYNEVVYVWGKENLNYIQKCGYDYRYVSDNTDFDFKYKLETLKLAYEEFEEVLFLDWDVESELSETEIKNLSFPNPCMPLYSYPKDFDFGVMPPKTSEDIENFSWKLNDNILVVPNACLIYFKGFDLGSELISLHKKYNFSTLIEEFAFYKWTNCDLDKYINEYDCPHMNGRPDESKPFLIERSFGFEEVNTTIKLNNFIGKKTIHFKHI